jgi:hypothetical protein
MPTNDHDQNPPIVHDPPPVRDAEHPGYEITDVNVNGISVFLAGLLGSVFIFFILCYVLGKAINTGIQKEDGPSTRWNQAWESPGPNLASNPAIEQKQLQRVTEIFPTPRLDTDDGNQATADLHAREDLLLDHYSTTPGQDGIRIPISRAMELIAQRGLPVAAATPEVQMAGEAAPGVQAPLTTGFARTGYELTVIKAREEKTTFRKAESAENAELTK